MEAPDERIITIPEHTLDANATLDLEQEMSVAGRLRIATRMAIERGNLLRYDDYQVQLTNSEVLEISNGLLEAKSAHVDRKNWPRVDRIDELCDLMLSHLEDGDE